MTYKNWIILLISSYTCFLVGYGVGVHSSRQEPIHQQVISRDTVHLQVQETPEMVMASVLEKKLTPEMTRLVIAQAKHESADFSSKLYNRTNNPFGMTQPRVRKTTSLGRATGGYARYTDLKAATIDYLYYLEARGFPCDISDPVTYVRLLKAKHYFEAPEGAYLKCINQHLKTVVSNEIYYQLDFSSSSLNGWIQSPLPPRWSVSSNGHNLSQIC